jgi:hypothetical protein
MLGWDRIGFEKKCNRTCYARVVFLHPVESTSHVVHCGASGARNGDALFLLLRWDRYRFNKKRDRTRYTELVFSHPVGYAGHVVHSCVSVARNNDALF